MYAKRQTKTKQIQQQIEKKTKHTLDSEACISYVWGLSWPWLSPACTSWCRVDWPCQSATVGSRAVSRTLPRTAWCAACRLWAEKHEACRLRAEKRESHMPRADYCDSHCIFLVCCLICTLKSSSIFCRLSTNNKHTHTIIITCHHGDTYCDTNLPLPRAMYMYMYIDMYIDLYGSASVGVSSPEREQQ